MTEAQARHIAERAITLHDETADLKVFEERGNFKEAREKRRAVSAAQAELNRAIGEIVER